MYFGLIYVLWLPLQGLFIRLLSVAAQRVLALLEDPPFVTALTPQGNVITLHSYITGVAQPLTQLNCADLHVSVVLSLALALAVSEQGWRGRLRLCGLALMLLFLILVVVCVVQVEFAAEGYASTHLGLTVHTAGEKAILDWGLRKSSFVVVFLLPAFLFFTAYVSTWAGPTSPERPGPRRVTRILAVTVGCLIVSLLLIPRHADEVDGVDLGGLRKIVTLNPASATAQLNLGFNLEKQGLHDEALASYRAALRLQPDLVAARFGEGNVLFSKGDYDAAAGCFEDVLNQRPDDAKARYNLGTAYLNAKRYERAKSAYESVLRSEPENPAALKNLGEALIGLNRPCDAFARLEQSVAIDPGMLSDTAMRGQLRVLSVECGSP